MGRRAEISVLPVIRPECRVFQNLGEWIGDYVLIELPTNADAATGLD